MGEKEYIVHIVLVVICRTEHIGSTKRAGPVNCYMFPRNFARQPLMYVMLQERFHLD